MCTSRARPPPRSICPTPSTYPSERFDGPLSDFVGARAGQLDPDVHRRGIGLRKQVDPEVAEGEEADNHERHHEHRGEDRATHAQFRQHGYSVRRFGDTFMPSASTSTSETATWSPTPTPLTISIRSPRRSPTWSCWAASLPAVPTSTQCSP